MCDQDNGVSLIIQLLQEIQHLTAGAAVKRAGRFVGKDDRGVACERAGDGNTLLLAAGQLAGQVPVFPLQADAVDLVPCPLRALVCGHARI